MITLQQCYDDCIKNLDFFKIQKVMKFLNWTWGTEEKEPTIQDMKLTCQMLFDDACAVMIQENTYSCSC